MGTVSYINAKSMLGRVKELREQKEALSTRWEDKKELITEIRAVMHDTHDQLERLHGTPGVHNKKLVLLNQMYRGVNLASSLGEEMCELSARARDLRVEMERYEDEAHERTFGTK